MITQESHFGRSEGALGLHLAHIMSWSDIRCRLDGLFEEAFLAEESSDERKTENYDAIRDFLKKLFEIDGDAVVNDGGWYPPLTKDGWNNPNSEIWYEQFPTSRSFRKVDPGQGKENLIIYSIFWKVIELISYVSNFYFLHNFVGNSKCNYETWTSYDSGCCTKDEPCGIGEGDCDRDEHCIGDLTCGDNNCYKDGGFPTRADCCYLNS